jgi:hypothetical protein
MTLMPKNNPQVPPLYKEKNKSTNRPTKNNFTKNVTKHCEKTIRSDLGNLRYFSEGKIFIVNVNHRM